MTYKIYIDERPIIICPASKWVEVQKLSGGYPHLNFEYLHDNLTEIIHNFEKNRTQFPGLILSNSNPITILNQFSQIYTPIHAAGGVVLNKQNQVLAIFRKGIWDLPKGKVESQESLEEAAIREVREETGIKEISLDKFITTTYHTYTEGKKGKKIIKHSHWFLMRSDSENTELLGQKEEGIELATWLRIEELQNKIPIYQNIIQVLNLIDPT